MNFRWPLIFASLICLFIGIWDLLGKLPDSTKAFNSSNVVKVTHFHAITFTPPRGTPRIKLAGSKGQIYVIDCLTHIQLCSSGRKGSDVLLEGTLFKVSGQFYWPIEASYASGRILKKTESIALYELFSERDAQFYRFWIALSIALFAFSAWFGRRSMFV